MNEAELKKQLAAWIDPGVIADALVDVMAEYIEPGAITFDNAKAFYDNFLETELPSALERVIRKGWPHGIHPTKRGEETPLAKWEKQAGLR